MAVDVYEMVVLIAGSAVQGQRLSAQGLAGGGEPQLPFLWGLRFVVGVQQVVPAEWAASALGLQEAQGGLIQRWGFTSATPVRPVVGQGRVVRGRRALDLVVAGDRNQKT